MPGADNKVVPIIDGLRYMQVRVYSMHVYIHEDRFYMYAAWCVDIAVVCFYYTFTIQSWIVDEVLQMEYGVKHTHLTQ